MTSEQGELIRLVIQEQDFERLTDEFWNAYDEDRTKVLGEQEFLMVVIDVLAELSSKYALSEDQMSL